MTRRTDRRQAQNGGEERTVGLQRLLVVRCGQLRLAVSEQNIRDLASHHGIARVQTHRFGEVLHTFFAFASLQQQRTQRSVRHGILRTETQSLATVPDGFAVVALLGENHAQIAVGIRHHDGKCTGMYSAGVALLDGLAQVNSGFLQPALIQIVGT